MNKIKRIVITGPESTGKSALTKELASLYQTQYNPEYAVEYIDALNRKYNQDDILQITKEQLKRENKLVKTANQYLFCDTGTLVPYIWSVDKFKSCHPWIIEQLETHLYDLYLLCNIDLAWEYHPQREDRNRRQYFFDWYKKELQTRQLPFAVVSGLGRERLENARRMIDDIDA